MEWFCLMFIGCTGGRHVAVAVGGIFFRRDQARILYLRGEASRAEHLQLLVITKFCVLHRSDTKFRVFGQRPSSIENFTAWSRKGGFSYLTRNFMF